MPSCSIPCNAAWLNRLGSYVACRSKHGQRLSWTSLPGQRSAFTTAERAQWAAQGAARDLPAPGTYELVNLQSGAAWHLCTACIVQFAVCSTPKLQASFDLEDDCAIVSCMAAQCTGCVHGTFVGGKPQTLQHPPLQKQPAVLPASVMCSDCASSSAAAACSLTHGEWQRQPGPTSSCSLVTAPPGHVLWHATSPRLWRQTLAAGKLERWPWLLSRLMTSSLGLAPTRRRACEASPAGCRQRLGGPLQHLAARWCPRTASAGELTACPDINLSRCGLRLLTGYNAVVRCF